MEGCSTGAVERNEDPLEEYRSDNKICFSLGRSSISKEKLVSFFHKKANGGGQIESIIIEEQLNGERRAIIEFENAECAQSLIGQTKIIHIIGNEVKVTICKFTQIFECCKVKVGTSQLNDIIEICPTIIPEIQEEFSVTVFKKDEDWFIEGDWYKICHTKKMLEMKLPGSSQNIEPIDEIENAITESAHSSSDQLPIENLPDPIAELNSPLSSHMERKTEAKSMFSKSDDDELISRGLQSTQNTDIKTASTPSNHIERITEAMSVSSESDDDELSSSVLQSNQNTDPNITSQNSVHHLGNPMRSPPNSKNDEFAQEFGESDAQGAAKIAGDGDHAKKDLDCGSQSSSDEEFWHEARTDLVESSLQLNSTMVNYVKRVRQREYEDILNECEVETSEFDGKIQFKFKKSGAAESGRKKMLELCEGVESSCSRDTFEPSDHVDDGTNADVHSFNDSSTDAYVEHLPENKFDITGQSRESVENAENFLTMQQNSSKSRLYFHKFSHSTLILSVHVGNIADASTDAIVNAANDKLNDGGGVTGAIYDAGGHRFKEGCRLLMRERQRRPLELGEVVQTEACGDLKCKSVLHAVAPRWSELKHENREEVCFNSLKVICENILDRTNLEGYRSISIPALGTGIYGVPLWIFCKAIAASMKDLADKIAEGSPSCLEEVHLVNYDMHQAQDIITILKKLSLE